MQRMWSAWRGVKEVVCSDIFAFKGGPFDTLLMMEHGIGMIATIEGLRRFLNHAGSLVVAGGQLLLDSRDVRVLDDPNNLAYLQANRQAGRYPGEIRMRFEFNGEVGPYCGCLHVDEDGLLRIRVGFTAWENEHVVRLLWS